MGRRLFGFILIFVGILCVCCPLILSHIHQGQVDQIISQMILAGERHYGEVEKDFVSNDVFEEPYLGYIVFPQYGVRRLIVDGTDQNILDQGYVGLFSTSAGLDDDGGNVILAGHSVSSVFACLHDIAVGDEVLVGTVWGVTRYVVEDKQVILDDDFSYFGWIDGQKVLTMITCMVDDHYRLVVRAIKS